MAKSKEQQLKEIEALFKLASHDIGDAGNFIKQEEE